MVESLFPTLLYSPLRTPSKFCQTLQAGATNFCKVEVNFHFTVILAPVRSVEVYSVKFSCTLQFTIRIVLCHLIKIDELIFSVLKCTQSETLFEKALTATNMYLSLNRPYPH